MGFFHQDGFVPAWKQAAWFAGENGRIATLPDIINGRLNQKLGSVPWEKYFTTRSTEYVGRTRGGNRILIVAHGIGPMATLDGILKAYSFHFKDTTRDRIGGRINYEEFYDLESGKFGDVAVIDLDRYLRENEYPFISHLRVSEAMVDPVLSARLGPKAEEYIQCHATLAREWHKNEAGELEENRYNLPDWEQYLDRRTAAHLRYSRENSDPLIVQVGGNSNCPYGPTPDMEKHFGDKLKYPLEKYGLPIAHLLSIGQLVDMKGMGEDCAHLTCDISCHGWYDGTRLAAICGSGELIDISEGPDPYKLLRRHWRKLMQPLPRTANVGFRMLMKVGNNWFTQYLKQGAGMDTHEPEFLVTSMKPVGKPVKFVTTVGGFHGFVKYDVKEVKALAPRGANAYTTVGEWDIVWHKGNPEYHRTQVQFYQIEVDASQRLIREDELCNDYDTLTQLVGE